MSLNFDPSKKLNKEQLAEISKAYLKGIGFEKQPALIYEQRDAGHPHIHIVTTNIKAEYGKSETKKAISTVLEKVLKEYKFTTIGELNAVLNQFNVAADIGSEHSRIRKNIGILYRVLDKDGNRFIWLLIVIR